GARLTATVAAEGLRVVRRHRHIETFLVDMLGLDWSEVHDEAEVLEHHLSDRIVDALDRALGHPTEDPHGHSIPDADGHLRERDLLPLESLEVGATGVVREVHADAPARLQRWKRLGFVPGCALSMIERHDFEDVMHIRVADNVVVTGTEGVTGILVERN
ncbi:MAG: metal-dependent transcriptional regulator, partial [Planctomycetota bacterium]